MNFYLINPDAEHRGILLIKKPIDNEALLSKIREVFEDRQ